MNRIGGMNEWMSKHIIVKSDEYQKLICVDPAGIDGKLFIRQLAERSPRLRANQ